MRRTLSVLIASFAAVTVILQADWSQAQPTGATSTPKSGTRLITLEHFPKKLNRGIHIP